MKLINELTKMNYEELFDTLHKEGFEVQEENEYGNSLFADTATVYSHREFGSVFVNVRYFYKAFETEKDLSEVFIGTSQEVAKRMLDYAEEAIEYNRQNGTVAGGF